MEKNIKRIIAIITIFGLIIGVCGNLFAHSGRTDSSGGHKDNKNKSGLGSYHYHCGGHPAHLHDNGYCPYSSNSSSVEAISETTSTKETVIKATGIKINENIQNMKVGETNKLTATITPENTDDKSITWVSSNEKVATVSSSGEVKALKSGSVNINVITSNGKTDKILITVEEVKEEKEYNNIVTPIKSEDLSNTSNNTEKSDGISTILGLGIIGGGAYWGYNKYKKSKK